MTDQRIPEALRRYAGRAILSDDLTADDVLIHQKGEMRFEADGKWMPFTAEQRFSARRVGFQWHAWVKMAPLVTAVVDDAYGDGHGVLDAKVWGVVPVAHAEGVEVDRGEAERYLAELPWNPMAILHNPELQFSDGEDGAIRVWAGTPETYVDLQFDDAGDVASAFTRTRCRNTTPVPWGGRFTDYRAFGPVRIPSRGEVYWAPPEGEFVYWSGEVTGWETVAVALERGCVDMD
ncbi:MAG: hypothetical protein JRH11_25940 [Deltaproteobacteria bacterium]|nr:hypothetical protein [Deltaproteobacteria bacterium]